ncbi:MAG: HRDC domain-containing protein, partial [Verrucomicrobia bacterium]|nr:HRDC domain-containing protein [Verrucomicrobiota bacterium]
KPNPPDPDAVWRLSGSGRMSRAELAILRELFFWREEQAIAANRPPFFILSHDALLAIAAAAARHASVEPLLPRRFSPQRHAGLLQAVARGCAVPPAERPEHVRRAVYHPSLTERRRFDELKHRRDGRAAELQLDPALIASRATLEALSRDGSKAANELMLWQREVMEL